MSPGNGASDGGGGAPRPENPSAGPAPDAGGGAAKPSHPEPKNGETILWVCCDIENTHPCPVISEMFEVAHSLRRR